MFLLLTDFFAPISSFINKPAKELEIVIEDVKSATQLRKENLLLKHEIKRLRNIERNQKFKKVSLLSWKKYLIQFQEKIFYNRKSFKFIRWNICKKTMLMLVKKME